MSLTSDEILKIMREAKELGITSLKVDGLELGGIQTPKKQEELSQDKLEEIMKQFSVLNTMSDREILYWSTPYGVQMENERLEKEQKLKEEGN